MKRLLQTLIGIPLLILIKITLTVLIGGTLKIREKYRDWRDAWACRKGRGGLEGVERLSLSDLLTRLEGQDKQALREGPEMRELLRRLSMEDALSRREMREQRNHPELHKRLSDFLVSLL